MAEGIPQRMEPRQYNPRCITRKPGTKTDTAYRQPLTKVVCVKQKSLNYQGYKDLKDWLTNPDHVYIGRDMTHYVPGAVGSKWQNPFHVKDYERDKCIDMYKEYIQTDTKKYDGKTLMESLEELRGKTLGCWCKPDSCHGDVIVGLLKKSGSGYS